MWWTDWVDSNEGQRHETRRLRDEWAGLLRGYPWHFFVTLTTAREYSRDALERQVRDYLARLEGVLGKRFWWAYAVEGGSLMRPNVHLLIGGVQENRADKIVAAWGRRGRTTIETTKERPNAVAYVVKSLELDYDHIDVVGGINALVSSWRQRERHKSRCTGLKRAAAPASAPASLRVGG